MTYEEILKELEELDKDLPEEIRKELEAIEKELEEIWK